MWVLLETAQSFRVGRWTDGGYAYSSKPQPPMNLQTQVQKNIPHIDEL